MHECDLYFRVINGEMFVDMHKIAVVERSSLYIQNFTQLFEFGFKMSNSDESRWNPHSGRLKD